MPGTPTKSGTSVCTKKRQLRATLAAKPYLINTARDVDVVVAPIDGADGSEVAEVRAVVVEVDVERAGGWLPRAHS